MLQAAKVAIILALKQVGTAIFISAISEAFLKKAAIYALKKLAKSTKNKLDDELVKQVEQKLNEPK